MLLIATTHTPALGADGDKERKMKDRKFGVEIECGFSRDRSRRIADRYADAGACEELINKAIGDGKIHEEWGDNIGRDGTLMEIRSPILQGAAGFKELHAVMNLLRLNGGFVTAADGMHVHHDAPEFVNDPAAVIRLVQSWRHNLPVIHQLVAPRRRNSGACPRWTSQGVETLSKFKEGTVTRVRGYYGTERDYADFKEYDWDRRDLNIESLVEHGTIEIRLHQGTLHPIQAEAWIRFGQSLLNKVALKARPVRKVETVDDLFKALRTPKYTQDNKELLTSRRPVTA